MYISAMIIKTPITKKRIIRKRLFVDGIPTGSLFGRRGDLGFSRILFTGTVRTAEEMLPSSLPVDE